MKELEPELLERIRIVQDPSYETVSLQKADYIKMFVVCVIIPIAMLIWGWRFQ